MTTDKTPDQGPERIEETDLKAAQGGYFKPAKGVKLAGPGGPLSTSPTGFDPSADLKAKGFNPQPEPPAVDPLNLKTKR